MKKFAYVLAAVAILLVGARVQADPITAIDGVNGVFTLTSQGAGSGNTATVSFNTSFTTQLNHMPLLPLAPTYLVNMSINTLGTHMNGGMEYLFNPSSYPNGQTIDFNPAMPGTQTATFNLNGAYAFVPDNNQNTMILSGLIGSSSSPPNTSGYDFTPFNDQLGQFTFTLNSSNNLNTLIATATPVGKDGPQLGSGSGSFSEVASPEPSSLVLLGLGSLGMAGYGWRRRKLALA
jgi:hypothetical protein